MLGVSLSTGYRGETMPEGWRRYWCEGVQSRVCRGRVAPALGGTAARGGRWISCASGVGGPTGPARVPDTDLAEFQKI